MKRRVRCGRVPSRALGRLARRDVLEDLVDYWRFGDLGDHTHGYAAPGTFPQVDGEHPF